MLQKPDFYGTMSMYYHEYDKDNQTTYNFCLDYFPECRCIELCKEWAQEHMRDYIEALNEHDLVEEGTHYITALSLVIDDDKRCDIVESVESVILKACKYRVDIEMSNFEAEAKYNAKFDL